MQLKGHEFSLSDETTCEPISHCWGDARNMESTTVEDCRIKVTRSLPRVHVRLRLEDRSRHPWTDAISIHQKDNVEKSDQVQMMQDTYRLGRRKLAWLGKGSRFSTGPGLSLIP